MSEKEQAFRNALLNSASFAEKGGLAMQVLLKGEEEERIGVPVVEWDTSLYVEVREHKITVGDTTFLPQEVRWFAVELP